MPTKQSVNEKQAGLSWRSSQFSWITHLRDALALAAIVGVVMATAFNLIVFEDWNLNYFQIASFQDFIVSSLYIGFISFIFILPLPFLLAVIWTAHTLARKIRVSLIQKFGWRRKKFVSLTVSYFYALSITLYLIIFAIALVLLFSDSNYFKIRDLSADELVFVVLTYFFLVCPLFAILEYPIRKIPIGTLTLFGLMYFLAWYLSFADTNRLRWYGYLSSNHVEFSGSLMSGCSKKYVLWIGENNTVVECWRAGKELDQQLYVIGHGGAILYGPVNADAAPLPPYYRNGPLLPPLDRMSSELKKKLPY